jgi:hypothetical protein
MPIHLNFQTPQAATGTLKAIETSRLTLQGYNRKVEKGSGEMAAVATVP